MNEEHRVENTVELRSGPCSFGDSKIIPSPKNEEFVRGIVLRLPKLHGSGAIPRGNREQKLAVSEDFA